MPVRSLRSSVLVWPKPAEVDDAVRRWAADVAAAWPELRRLGYFGSYARGDWGVGSDLDIVAVVVTSEEPFDRRALRWDHENRGARLRQRRRSRDPTPADYRKKQRWADAGVPRTVSRARVFPVCGTRCS